MSPWYMTRVLHCSAAISTIETRCQNQQQYSFMMLCDVQALYNGIHHASPWADLQNPLKPLDPRDGLDLSNQIYLPQQLHVECFTGRL